ncbi:hypothetical protein X801_08004 [Opisthorchis viverrini]|uniref:26S proteasome regulatory subunit RPN2 C-terminal domain-containing protein n=1 Tax=Opisthorchis viverrini TaxID=6198 RepID=A0A1S8WP58_OPIVI|nr:hypothetical protein X801_08004 [Opisthorchis viverrini]
MLNNPARVMRVQQRVMALPESSRYYTLKPITQAGILMVHDRRPQDAEVLVEIVHGHGPTGDRNITSASAAGTTGVAGLPVPGTGGSEARVTEKADVEMSGAAGTTPSSGTKRDKSKTSASARHGKSGSSSNVEPSPPEPFLYVEEGTEPPVTAVPPTTSTSATVAAKEAPSHEPMEVEEEPSEGGVGSNKKDKEDKSEKKDDVKK